MSDINHEIEILENIANRFVLPDEAKASGPHAHESLSDGEPLVHDHEYEDMAHTHEGYGPGRALAEGESVKEEPEDVEEKAEDEPDTVSEAEAEEKSEDHTAEETSEESQDDEEIQVEEKAEVIDSENDDAASASAEKTDTTMDEEAKSAIDSLLDQMANETIVTESEIAEDEADIEAKDDIEPDSEQVETLAKVEVADDEFLCGIQRKSVKSTCEFCNGGCAPSQGLPGLAEIEADALKTFPDSEIITSGYSSADDMYVLDIKRADGSAVEAFISGDGVMQGWLKLDEDQIDTSVKSLDIVDPDAAAKAATEVIDGTVLDVFAGSFMDEDAYTVQLAYEGKEYDVFVSVKGDVLAYDEFDAEPLEDGFDEAELAEIKMDEAELELKRMYSRERRNELAKNGHAMPDGSFPIVDTADLRNAIIAHGRAKDPAAAKRHIIKRARALGAVEMLPEGWADGDSKDIDVDVDTDDVVADEETKADVIETPLDLADESESDSFIKDLAEFRNLMEGLNADS